MTFDEKIAGEIRNTLDERYGTYCVSDKIHHFSLAYKIKKHYTIRSIKNKNAYRKGFSVRKVKYLVIAVLLAIFLLVGFSLWLTISRFSFNFHQDHSDVYITPNEGDKIRIEEIYILSDNMEFTLTERFIDNVDIISIYEKGESKVTLSQSVIDDIHKINTEYSSPEPIVIQGFEGYYVQMSRSENLVVWTMDGYLFDIGGNISKNELIKLAQSTKIKKIVENP